MDEPGRYQMYQAWERSWGWVLVNPTRERPNESYMEATVRIKCCSTVARQRRVGEHRGRPTLPKQRRLGIARSLKRSTRLSGSRGHTSGRTDARAGHVFVLECYRS